MIFEAGRAALKKLLKGQSGGASAYGRAQGFHMVFEAGRAALKKLPKGQTGLCISLQMSLRISYDI
jgi:hypothetical protein